MNATHEKQIFQKIHMEDLRTHLIQSFVCPCHNVTRKYGFDWGTVEVSSVCSKTKERIEKIYDEKICNSIVHEDVTVIFYEIKKVRVSGYAASSEMILSFESNNLHQDKAEKDLREYFIDFAMLYNKSYKNFPIFEHPSHGAANMQIQVVCPQQVFYPNPESVALEAYPNTEKIAPYLTVK